MLVTQSHQLDLRTLAKAYPMRFPGPGTWNALRFQGPPRCISQRLPDT